MTGGRKQSANSGQLERLAFLIKSSLTNPSTFFGEGEQERIKLIACKEGGRCFTFVTPHSLRHFRKFGSQTSSRLARSSTFYRNLNTVAWRFRYKEASRYIVFSHVSNKSMNFSKNRKLEQSLFELWKQKTRELKFSSETNTFLRLCLRFKHAYSAPVFGQLYGMA